MAVKRIVANIATDDVAGMREFYEQLFGLEAAMDFGWIVTLSASGSAPVLLSLASEGGSGTQVPDLSIEVDDFGAVLERAKAMDVPIEYGPRDEPWGVRRFYIRDPAGTLLNILEHT